MSSVVDLEAQQVAQAASRAEEVEGAETRKIDILGPHTSVARSLRSVSAGQDINDAAQSVASHQGSGGGDVPEINIEQPSSDDVSRTTNDRQTQTDALTPDPILDPDPRDATSDSEPDQHEEPRMIGDFDGSANEFWKLYRDEAKSHDDARINTLKAGMDSALIFAGLFSAVLTAFVVDSKQNLKPSPSDETVYYLRQHSTILYQISVQLSSIAPQVAIPSTPPPPFPPFSPLASDIRVNVFWFMALAFSLLAALLAILVQQWVRNYMHVFQQYGDPLKSSRLRQYLYEGYERWYMRRVAEVVPGFLHISLFLFFGGLGDSLLNINTEVALSTIIPIGFSGLLYILTTFVPIIYLQSPYQNSFSGIFWYLFQKSRGRKFRDRGSDGEMRSVSANMAQGQMQLAMEQTEARKGRDERAIRWLIDNLTEDAEMEKFLSAIPGSFNTDWGTDVWKRVGEHHKSEDQSQDEPIVSPHMDTTHQHSSSSSWRIRSAIMPIIHLVMKPAPRHLHTHATTHSPVLHPPDPRPQFTTPYFRENIVHELSTRVARSVEKCKNRKLFSNDDLWRKRTRACIEATASLVCCANANPAWFGGISKLLGDIGCFEKIRELSLEGTDQLFVMRWTCLSLVVIRPILAKSHSHLQRVRFQARDAMPPIVFAAEEDDTGDDGDDGDLAAVQKIDKNIQKSNDCLFQLYEALRYTPHLTEQVKRILRGHKSQISELEQINIETIRPGWIDTWISRMQNVIKDDSHQIISQFPGVFDDFDLDYEEPISFSRLIDLSRDLRTLQFMRPRRTLMSMCSPAMTFRDILDGQGDADAYKELLENLEIFPFTNWHGDETQQQLWRLQDLGDGGGLGFTVELFFLALSQLLSTSSSRESHSALYTGTFRAITSDWSKYKHSLGTQKLFLYIALSRRREFDDDYIVEEFLVLLHNIFEGQVGPHIDEAIEELIPRPLEGVKFEDRLLKAITDIRAPSHTLFFI